MLKWSLNMCPILPVLAQIRTWYLLTYLLTEFTYLLASILLPVYNSVCFTSILFFHAFDYIGSRSRLFRSRSRSHWLVVSLTSPIRFLSPNFRSLRVCAYKLRRVYTVIFHRSPPSWLSQLCREIAEDLRGSHAVDTAVWLTAMAAAAAAAAWS